MIRLQMNMRLDGDVQIDETLLTHRRGELFRDGNEAVPNIYER